MKVVDISMLDCQVAILENAIARYVATGDIPGPLGSRHPSIAPFAAFATKDGHIVIAAGTDALFARIANVLARPELARGLLAFLTKSRSRRALAGTSGRHRTGVADMRLETLARVV